MKKRSGTLPLIKRQKKLILIILLAIIAVVSAIIVVYPFLPAIKYYLNPPPSQPLAEEPNNNSSDKSPEYSIAKLPGESIEESVETPVETPPAEIPAAEEPQQANPIPVIDPSINQLIIPKIGVQIPIVEGEDESVLNKGAWRLPMTSTPDQGGNTVLTGHRYKYRPPHKKTFYLLDKLTAGDEFQIFWQGEEYNYRVVSSIIVNPDAVEVINPTLQPTVTLITCTPLFSTKQRLIVSGELITNP